MSQEELDRGKEWIRQRFTAIAAEKHLALDRLEWAAGTEDFKAGTVGLVIEARGRAFVERFPEAHVEDLPGDTGVRTGIERYLHELVARIAAS